MNRNYTVDMTSIQTVLALSDTIAIRTAKLEELRDYAQRAMIYSLTAKVAQRLQWEETQTVPRKLSWRERIHALLGGELPLTLNVKQYRNCPHIQADKQSDHFMFLAKLEAEPREAEA